MGSWHLFGDNLAALTEGRYYFASKGTPHYPNQHNLWSREWLDQNWTNVVSLGEDLDAKHTWYNGASPPVQPRVTLAGSADCIRDGERYALRLVRGDQGLLNGFPRACFTNADVRDAWMTISAIDRCPVQKLFAWIIWRMYADDAAGIAAVYQDWIGPGRDVRFVPATATLPAISAVVDPTFTICVLDGTRNFQTWALHAFDALESPRNMGIFGTALFWYNTSTYVIDQLEAMPIVNDAPILLVGHSYGAIVAALVAARIRAARPNQTIALLTFGMPKPGDARLIALLARMTSFHLVNNHDTITLLPPELPQLLTLIPWLGPAVVNLWSGWERPNNVTVQDGDGNLANRPADEPDTAQLLFLVSQALSHQSLDARFGHQIEEYWRRLERRCPLAQWPINEPVNDEVQSILGWKFDGGTKRENRTAAIAFDGGDGPTFSSKAAVAFGGAGALGVPGGEAAAIAFDGAGLVSVVPGATCPDGPTITLGVEYTFSLTSPANHWFKFPAANGQQYHVKITLNSGLGVSASVTTGTCGSPTFQFVVAQPGTACNTFTPGSDTTAMIQVSTLIGTVSYTIVADTGACP